jgi:hypothetical protein
MMNYHVITVYESVEVQVNELLYSALERGEWSASSFGRFTSGNKAFVTHRTGG